MTTPNPRPVVAQSWKRCFALGMSRDSLALAPIRLAGPELGNNALTAAFPACSALLGEAVRECGCVFALADASGLLIHVEGEARARAACARVNFVVGADWAEPAAGTNAIGTALAVSGAVRVVGLEHFFGWAGSFASVACPVREPRTGQVIGVLGVLGPADAGTTTMLALVRATARVAESELAQHVAVPASSLRVVGNRVRQRSGAGIALSVLGRDRALLEIDGQTYQLTPRHSEIVMLIRLAPSGLTAEDLAERLSPDGLSPTSIRVEISRLRRQLGEELFTARPYALLRPVHTDVDTVSALLALGRAAEALEAYPGPPLPASHTPEVVRCGQELRESLREAVLGSYNPQLLRRWVATPDGNRDRAAWEALAGLMPVGSPQREQAAARAVTLA